MSWRLLLAAGYALLVEGLPPDGRAEIDRALDPAAFGVPDDERKRAEQARERLLMARVGAEVG